MLAGHGHHRPLLRLLHAGRRLARVPRPRHGRAIGCRRALLLLLRLRRRPVGQCSCLWLRHPQGGACTSASF